MLENAVGLASIERIWVVISDEGPEVFWPDFRLAAEFCGLEHFQRQMPLRRLVAHHVLRADAHHFETPSPGVTTGVVVGVQDT